MGTCRRAAWPVAGLALAAVLAQPVFTPAPAAAAPAERASLVLSPTSGDANTVVTGVVRITSATGCRAEGVLYTWDGIRVGAAAVDRSTCQAVAQFRAPDNRKSRGKHTIAARVVGATNSRLSASAVFTIGKAAATQSPTPRTSTPRSASPLPPPPTIVIPTQGPVPTEGEIVEGAGAGGGDGGSPLGLGYLLGIVVLLLGAGAGGYAIWQMRRDRGPDDLEQPGGAVVVPGGPEPGIGGTRVYRGAHLSGAPASPAGGYGGAPAGGYGDAAAPTAVFTRPPGGFDQDPAPGQRGTPPDSTTHHGAAAEQPSGRGDGRPAGGRHSATDRGRGGWHPGPPVDPYRDDGEQYGPASGWGTHRAH